MQGGSKNGRRVKMNPNPLDELKAFLESDRLEPMEKYKQRQAMECRVYDYVGESHAVYQKYLKGELDAKQGIGELDKIHDKAFKVIPYAEEDGDISYTHCSLMSKIIEDKRTEELK